MADQYPKYPTQMPQDEHDNSSTPFTKRVLLYLWDAINVQKVRARGNSDGSLSVGGLNLPVYDYISLVQAPTTDTYTYKSGGSGGTTVATVVVTWTDNTKTTLSSVSKS